MVALRCLRIPGRGWPSLFMIEPPFLFSCLAVSLAWRQSLGLSGRLGAASSAPTERQDQRRTSLAPSRSAVLGCQPCPFPDRQETPRTSKKIPRKSQARPDSIPRAWHPVFAGPACWRLLGRVLKAMCQERAKGGPRLRGSSAAWSWGLSRRVEHHRIMDHGGGTNVGVDIDVDQPGLDVDLLQAGEGLRLQTTADPCKHIEWAASVCRSCAFVGLISFLRRPSAQQLGPHLGGESGPRTLASALATHVLSGWVRMGRETDE